MLQWCSQHRQVGADDSKASLDGSPGGRN
jgi:hypothetical protein